MFCSRCGSTGFLNIPHHERRLIQMTNHEILDWIAVHKQKYPYFMVCDCLGVGEMLVAGIDPGKTGAAALFDGRVVVDIYDWQSSETAFAKLANWRQVLGCSVAYIEIRYGAPIPGNGWKSIIGLARNIGAWDSMLAVAGFRVVPVNPKAWQSRLLLPGPGSTKERSVETVRKLFPEVRRFVFNAGHHGRADAVMVAVYGYNREV